MLPPAMKNSGSKTQSEIRSQRRHGIGLLVIGWLALATAVPFYLQARTFNATALHAPGKIVEMVVELCHRKAGELDEHRYIPVFAFADKSGATHIVHSRVTSTHPEFAVGDAVEVLYLADAPEDAKLNEFFMLWLWPLVFGGIGLVLVVVGLILLQGAVAWARMAAR
ncbi:MAG: hypothetical protein RLZZ350_1819 [Verrucomicrobiota bacterium]|jgi:hypothetical protein